MKFVSFIASTMMIVLISQHSIMGFPVENKVEKKTCSEGFVLVSGRCVPIKSELNKNEMESSSAPLDDSFTHEEKPVGLAAASPIVGACPDGEKRNKYGMCQAIKLSDTTEVSVEATTDVMEKSQGEENPRGCPEGTEHDERGSCQEINPTESKKTLDPKFLLQKNGDCPQFLQKVNGQCLYIKPKTKSANGDIVSSDMRSKGGNEENGKLALTSVLSDNSCPDGTEYKGYGVCQERIRPLSPNVPMKSDGSCPDDYELVNDKCTHKNSMIQDNSELPKPMKKARKSPHTEHPLPKPISHAAPATGEGEPDV